MENTRTHSLEKIDTTYSSSNLADDIEILTGDNANEARFLISSYNIFSSLKFKSPILIEQ